MTTATKPTIFWPCTDCGIECWGHISGVIKHKMYCNWHYKIRLNEKADRKKNRMR